MRVVLLVAISFLRFTSHEQGMVAEWAQLGLELHQSEQKIAASHVHMRLYFLASAL